MLLRIRRVICPAVCAFVIAFQSCRPPDCADIRSSCLSVCFLTCDFIIIAVYPFKNMLARSPVISVPLSSLIALVSSVYHDDCHCKSACGNVLLIHFQHLQPFCYRHQYGLHPFSHRSTGKNRIQCNFFRMELLKLPRCIPSNSTTQHHRCGISTARAALPEHQVAGNRHKNERPVLLTYQDQRSHRDCICAFSDHNMHSQHTMLCPSCSKPPFAQLIQQEQSHAVFVGQHILANSNAFRTVCS